MPATELRALRTRVESGALGIDGAVRQAVIGRIDDVAADVDAALRAMALLPHPDVATAAAHLAHVFYLTGTGWRQYLAEAAGSVTLVPAITDAIAADAGFAIAQLSAAIRGAPPVFERRDDATFGLRCAVCAADAVTFTVTRTGAAGPHQVVMTSLSPVTVFRPIAGPRMRDLLGLLEQGDAMAVIRHLLETHPAGCDAWCASCERVFCRAHTAVEARWSGSWHESTSATCPVGHVRDIE